MGTNDVGRYRPSWTQQSLIRPYLSRIDLLVHLDGVNGTGQVGASVHHNIDRELVLVDCHPGVPLDLVVNLAVRRLAELLRTELDGLSPF
jgi:hypothetical protein